MAIKVNGINVINDGRKGEFRSTNPGRYTEVERDNLTPAVGDIVFNTTENELQVWNGTEWASAGGASMIIEQEDFAYAPSSNTATLLGPSTATNPTGINKYIGLNASPSSGTATIRFETSSNPEFFRLVNQLTAGDPVDLVYYNGGTEFPVSTTFNSLAAYTSGEVDYTDLIVDSSLGTFGQGDYPFSITSVNIIDGTEPLKDGDIMMYDIDTQKWTATSGDGVGRAPAANSATLTEDELTDKRFTNQGFTTEVEMFQEGQPVSTKSIKGKVTADFPVYPETNPIEAGITTDFTPTYIKNAKSNGQNYMGVNNSDQAFGLIAYDSVANKVRDFMYVPTDNNDDQIRESPDNMENFVSYLETNNNGQDSGDAYDIKVNRSETYANIWINFNASASIKLAELLSGNSSTHNNYQYCTTTKYEYRIGRNFIARRPVGSDGSWGGSRSFNDQYSNWTFVNVVETSPDAIVLAWKDSGDNARRTRFYTLTDAKSDSEGGGDAWNEGSGINSDFLLQGPNLGSVNPAVYHKGGSFWAWQEGIYRLADGQNQMQTITPPSLPSDGQDWGVSNYTLWEEPVTNKLVCRAIFYNFDTAKRWYYYFGSNNSGATWTPDFYPTCSEATSDPSFIGTGNVENCLVTDKYSYGRRLAFFRQAGLASTSYAQTIASVYTVSLYAVTVNNGADLNQINIGDVVKTSNVDNPYDYFKVASITDNGNGTTTLNLSGFGVPVEGSTLQTVNSIGNAPLSKWLVIGASGNIASLTSVEPDYVAIGPSTTVPLQFPAQFPTGNAPDNELPAGTSIQTLIKTENAAGESEVVSNVVTPTGVVPPAIYSFGLESFSINNAEPFAEEEYKIKWISDSCGDLSNTTDATADEIWRTQNYYTSKSITNGGCLEGFKNNYIRNSKPNNIDFTFTCADLQNKIIVFGFYGRAGTSQGSSSMYSEMTTSTAGVSIYENGNFEINEDLNSNGMFTQKLKVDITNITSIDVNFKFGSNSSSTQDPGSIFQLLYWRLEDINGNELPTVKP